MAAMSVNAYADQSTDPTATVQDPKKVLKVLGDKADFYKKSGVQDFEVVLNLKIVADRRNLKLFPLLTRVTQIDLNRMFNELAKDQNEFAIAAASSGNDNDNAKSYSNDELKEQFEKAVKFFVNDYINFQATQHKISELSSK